MNQHYLSALFVAWTGLALADFVPDDHIVSNPENDFPGPEFDRATNRVIWQDRQNRLWIGSVDPVTGALIPANGRGQEIDSGLAPAGQVGNTPRYTFGGDQDALIYTKLSGTEYQLTKALETEPNVWQITVLENGLDRWKPNGTPEETTGPAMIVYNREAPNGTVVSWRLLDDPASEQTAQVFAQGGRFLGAEPYLLVLNGDANDVGQVYQIPFATGVPEQITFGDQDKENAFIWWAPEYEDYLFIVMIEFSELGFYRRVDGVWTNFYQLAIPNGKPFLSSPEAFIFDGRSYVTVVSCDELGSGGFQGQPHGPSEIWITGIDPVNPFFRRIDDPGYLAQRSEPEPYILDTEPVVYYTELDATGDIRLIKRAKTGFIHDTDGDGVADASDNCQLRANASQRDTNGDGYGNVCDTDLDNNGIVNYTDLGLFTQVVFTNDADADFNGDGVVSFTDLGTLKSFFFLPPGPSGLIVSAQR
jgi:hypothetical protein